MVCSSGVGFDPVVDGTHHTFDVFGLYNGLFVMDDRQTGTVWTHYDGRAIQGPLAGASMEMILLTHLEWEAWLELHPDTLVLDINTPYQRQYRTMQTGGGGLGPQFQESLLHRDERLPINELVLGVQAEDQFRAYVLADMAGVGVIHDVLGETPLVVFYDSESRYALAFNPVVDDEMLTFVVDGDVIRDEQTASVWTLDGMASEGPLAGTQLAWQTSFVTEWYGWAAYHPSTDIYGR